MTSIIPTVSARWDVQATPTADIERLLRLLFGEDSQSTAVRR